MCSRMAYWRPASARCGGCSKLACLCLTPLLNWDVSKHVQQDGPLEIGISQVYLPVVSKLCVTLPKILCEQASTGKLGTEDRHQPGASAVWMCPCEPAFGS
jgi:hypothetical protein